MREQDINKTIKKWENIAICYNTSIRSVDFMHIELHMNIYEFVLAYAFGNKEKCSQIEIDDNRKKEIMELYDRLDNEKE